MNSNIDITEFIVEQICWLFGAKESNQELKTDLSQCFQTSLSITFFTLWYLIEEDESKYIGIGFAIQMIYCLLQDIFIIFCQGDYILGTINDLNYRETYGKIFNFLQNFILLIYFGNAIYKLGQDSSENKFMLIYAIILASFNIISIFKLCYDQRYSCSQSGSASNPPESGQSVFILFCLIGLGVAFYEMYLSYIYLVDHGEKPTLFLCGMLGDGVIFLFGLFALCAACATDTTSMNWHKCFLMIVEGLAFGLGCIFVSIVVGIITICVAVVYGIKWAREHSQVAAS